jgi:hypothetical protein
MHERLRTRHVTDIVRDVGLLSGASFERFGYRLIEHAQPASWAHPGTTVSGAPVGYAVDSVAEGGRLIAQYSARADYLGSDLSKLKGDIAHALKMRISPIVISRLGHRDHAVGRVIGAERRGLSMLRCRSWS